MTVYLVGAGPGDPGLITTRGAALLGAADVVVFDRLSAPELLELAPDGAELIDVGKSPGHHRLSQSEIDDLLVERGRSGLSVVRLKGGDPFVFARGSEEAAALEAAGVDYEIIPGVSSAIAVPAYAGIPVTRRFSSTSVTIVTGHTEPDADDDTVDWESLAHLGGTIVILMGVRRWPAIAERLMAAGLAGTTPAAAVQWGTRPDQTTVRATLGTLGDHELRSPSVIVVGEVAAMALGWFTDRPLFGSRIVVTRARAQSSALAERLRALGAEVIEAPVIRAAEPSDGGRGLTAALGDLAGFDWLVLTSPVGAERTLSAIADVRALSGVGVAVIGTGTAEVVRRHRIEPDLIPEHFFAESLLAAFPPAPPGGGRVLLSIAEDAREVLADGLEADGWDLEVVHPYRTEAVPIDAATAERIAEADVVTFTASSTVANLLAELGAETVPPIVVSIGPVTSARARAAGLTVTAEADPHTIDGLVAAVIEAVEAEGGGNRL